MIRTNLLKLTVAAMLLGASLASHAAEPVRVSGVGPWIAAQGNAALREIGDEMKQNINETLRPLMPTDAPKRPESSPKEVAAVR